MPLPLGGRVSKSGRGTYHLLQLRQTRAHSSGLHGRTFLCQLQEIRPPLGDVRRVLQGPCSLLGGIWGRPLGIHVL
jgi:hypothetical protein